MSYLAGCGCLPRCTRFYASCKSLLWIPGELYQAALCSSFAVLRTAVFGHGHLIRFLRFWSCVALFGSWGLLWSLRTLFAWFWLLKVLGRQAGDRIRCPGYLAWYRLLPISVWILIVTTKGVGRARTPLTGCWAVCSCTYVWLEFKVLGMGLGSVTSPSLSFVCSGLLALRKLSGFLICSNVCAAKILTPRYWQMSGRAWVW